MISPAEFAALPTRQQLRRVERLVRQALPLYGLPPDSGVRLLNYSENATYLIEPGQGPRRVLRINRPGYHPRAFILTELDWVSALQRETEIRTASPLPGRDGECVQYVWHPDVPEPRHCVLMSFVEGQEPDDSNRHEAFELLGGVTARLHLHAASWKPARPVRRERWDVDAMIGPRGYWGRWQDGPDLDPSRTRLLQRLAKAVRPPVEALGESRSRFGLIHADLRAANLLVHDGQVAVIDFDDCGFSWFIYDLAAALSFIEAHPDVPAYIEAWLRGYTRLRKLSKAERDAIPALMMLRRLLLLAWIGSHADTAQAQAVRPGFTEDTCRLAEAFLSRHT